MGLFEHWPYTNFHDLNLDWIIKKIPEVFTASAQAVQSAETAVSAKNDAVAAKDAAQLSAENAAASEGSAGQSAESAQNYAEHIADPVGGLVTGWLDDNITPTTPPVDASLTVQGAAADAKKTGDEISDLRSEITQLEAIPHEVKVAMDNLFAKLMYMGDPSGYYATFHAWASAANLISISAVFNQGSNVIYDIDALDNLKQYLTVTANYDNGTSGDVTGYALSGTLVEGTSVITVTYADKTATFNVIVTKMTWDYEWSYLDGGMPSDVAPSVWSTYKGSGANTTFVENEGLYFNAGNGYTQIRPKASETSSSGAVEIVANFKTFTNYTNLVLRLGNGTNGIQLSARKNGILMITNDATPLEGITLNTNTDYTFRTEYNQSSIKAYVNGVKIYENVPSTNVPVSRNEVMLTISGPSSEVSQYYVRSIKFKVGV